MYPQFFSPAITYSPRRASTWMRHVHEYVRFDLGTRRRSRKRRKKRKKKRFAIAIPLPADRSAYAERIPRGSLNGTGTGIWRDAREVPFTIRKNGDARRRLGEVHDDHALSRTMRQVQSLQLARSSASY